MKSTILLLFMSVIVCCNSSFTIPDKTNVSPVSRSTEPDPATVKFAFKDFLNLSRTERRERFREVKKEIRNFKAAKRAGSDVNVNQLVLVILAIFLPPLAVYLHEGAFNKKFFIDLALALFFFIPGFWFLGLLSSLYALVVVLGK